jgi:hypothetical protein
MDEVVFALYWWTIFALAGGIVALVFPVRRRWLVLPIVLLALVVVVPALFAHNGGIRHAGRTAVAMAPFVLTWTAGVYAGSGVRVRLWRRLRREDASSQRPAALP